MGQHQRNGQETLGSYSQRCESGPALKARGRQEIVQASTIITEAISCLPDRQQLLVCHIGLVYADKKTAVLPHTTIVKYSCHNYLLLRLLRLLLRLLQRETTLQVLW